MSRTQSILLRSRLAMKAPIAVPWYPTVNSFLGIMVNLNSKGNAQVYHIFRQDRKKT
jgi:hypothetical protein